MSDLHLHVKTEYFEDIKRGEKTEAGCILCSRNSQRSRFRSEKSLHLNQNEQNHDIHRIQHAV